jgi:hypothetical protein
MSKRLDGRSERAVKDRWLSVLQHKADEMMMMMTGGTGPVQTPYRPRKGCTGFERLLVP